MEGGGTERCMVSPFGLLGGACEKYAITIAQASTFETLIFANRWARVVVAFELREGDIPAATNLPIGLMRQERETESRKEQRCPPSATMTFGKRPQ